jgi:hypothetical protein
MQITAEQAERRARLMSSFRRRLQLADEERAEAEAAQENPLERDPWFVPTSRLKGRVDWDGTETIQSREVLDALGVPVAAKRSALYRRLTQVRSVTPPPLTPFRWARSGR